MRKDKEQAIVLRIRGKSYNEISRTLSISKSTLSGWLSHLVLSSKAQKRIEQRVYHGSLRGLLKRNKNQTSIAIRRMHESRDTGSKEIHVLTREDLKFVGIALYWAEGYKRLIFRNGRERTYHPVTLTNSDPKLVSIFLRFLREVCGVDDGQIVADVRIYEHMSEKYLLHFWQKITHLPPENFRKVYYGVSKSSQGKRPFNRLPYGTIAIRVNNTALFHKIMGWIEGVARQAQ